MLNAPSLLFVGSAVVLLLIAVLLWPRRRRRHGHTRPARALTRGSLAVLVAVLALLTATLGILLLGFARLNNETRIADIRITQHAPQRFELLLDRGSGEAQRYLMRGDQWRIEARVLRWKLPATLAGVPPLYQLDRLSGRYLDTGQAIEAERSVYALNGHALPDLWSLKRQYARWLPMVDADQGSGVYLPMLDGAHYTLSIDARSTLLARPDAATQQLLDEHGW